MRTLLIATCLLFAGCSGPSPEAETQAAAELPPNDQKQPTTPSANPGRKPVGDGSENETTEWRLTGLHKDFSLAFTITSPGSCLVTVTASGAIVDTGTSTWLAADAPDLPSWSLTHDFAGFQAGGQALIDTELNEGTFWSEMGIPVERGSLSIILGAREIRPVVWPPAGGPEASVEGPPLAIGLNCTVPPRIDRVFVGNQLSLMTLSEFTGGFSFEDESTGTQGATAATGTWSSEQKTLVRFAVPNMAQQDFVTVDLTDETGSPQRWIPSTLGAHLFQHESPPGDVSVTVSASLSDSQPALLMFASGCEVATFDSLVANEGAWC